MMYTTDTNQKTYCKIGFWLLRLSFYMCLVLFFSLLTVQKGHANPSAKNIILMISDGCGIKHIEVINDYINSTSPY
jgi:alkaline phosphatase